MNNEYIIQGWRCSNIDSKMLHYRSFGVIVCQIYYRLCYNSLSSSQHTENNTFQPFFNLIMPLGLRAALGYCTMATV